MRRILRIFARLPEGPKVKPDTVLFSDVSSDVIDSYMHRVEAYATMIVVGSLLFGFAATSPVTAAQPDNYLDSVRQNVESCLLMGTLAAAAVGIL